MTKHSTGTKIAIGILSTIIIIVIVLATLMCCVAVRESRLRKNAKVVFGTCDEYAWSDSDVYDPNSYPKITTEDGSIRILQLTDIHYRNQGTFGASIGINDIVDSMFVSQAKKMVKEYNPDLIVITGDLITVEYADAAYAQLGDIIEDLGVKWTMAMGNHDATYNADKLALFNVFDDKERYPNFIFSYGPTNFTHVVTERDLADEDGEISDGLKPLLGKTINTGIGNFAINVFDEKGDIKSSLIMMDSNDWNLEEKPDYKYSTPSADFYPMQVQWYEWLINGMNAYAGRTVPSLVFSHIGIGVDGTNKYGFGDAITNLNSTQVTFCGHTHAKGYFFDEQFAGGVLHQVNGNKAGWQYMEDPNTGGTIIDVSSDGDVTVKLINANPFSVKVMQEKTFERR